MQYTGIPYTAAHLSWALRGPEWRNRHGGEREATQSSLVLDEIGNPDYPYSNLPPGLAVYRFVVGMKMGGSFRTDTRSLTFFTDQNPILR